MGASDYMEYSYMYSFLVISEFFFVIAGLWGIYLSYALKTHVTLLIYLLGAVFNIIILGLFLPLYGIIVAPLSILTTNIFMATLMFIVSFRMERKFLKSIL
jgi:O-antigen/teichoic acid export membrane protein